jgi:hypothetical protein
VCEEVWVDPEGGRGECGWMEYVWELGFLGPKAEEVSYWVY